MNIVKLVTNFQVSKEEVFEKGQGVGGWGIQVRRSLKEDEEVEFYNLLRWLADYKVNNENDKRIWKPDMKNGFSVKSYYNLIAKNDEVNARTEPFKHIWR